MSRVPKGRWGGHSPAGRALSLACVAILTACAGTGVQDELGPADAIQAVLAHDSELGAARNHAPERMPLAAAVHEYVAGLDRLSLESCPEDFATAMSRHREAWRDSIAFFEAYGDLRGEMHDLFDEIRARGEVDRAGLEAVEAEIWGTWADVERSAERFGADTR